MIRYNLSNSISLTLIRSIAITASLLISFSLLLSWFVNQTILTPSLLAQSETETLTNTTTDTTTTSEDSSATDGFSLTPAEINLDLTTQQPVEIESVLENNFDFAIGFEVSVEIDQEVINFVEVDIQDSVLVEPNSNLTLDAQIIPIALEDYESQIIIKINQISGDNRLSNPEQELIVNVNSTINSDTSTHQLEFTIVLAVIISSILGLIATGIWHFRSSRKNKKNK